MEAIEPAASYRARAEEALRSAHDALRDGHRETAISRAYYACYYAIHAQLEALGETAGSHKQTGIVFRALFIKSGRLGKKYSVIYRTLSESRMDADYSPTPNVTHAKAVELVAAAQDFVSALRTIK